MPTLFAHTKKKNKRILHRWSTFYFTQSSENFEVETNQVTKFPDESVPKIRKSLNQFRKANHSTENSSRKIKWSEVPGTKFAKFWVHLTRLSPLSQIQIRIFHRMESAHDEE